MKESGTSRYTSLRFKIIASTIILSLVPLIVTTAYLIERHQTTYRERIEKDLQTRLENKRITIDLFLQERIAQLKTIASSHSFEKLSDGAFLNSLLATIQANSSSFVDLGILTSDGVHAAYAGPFHLQGFNYKDEHWFQQVTLRGVCVSDVFMGYRKFPHFIIAVTRQNGGKSWVLRATIDSAVFEGLVKAVQLGAKGDAFLVNKDNILQSSSRFHGDILSTVELPDHKNLTTSALYPYSFGESQLITGIAKLRGNDWYLAIIEDPREDMSPVSETKHLASLFAFLGILVIVLGAVFNANAIVRMVMRADNKKALLDASFLQSAKMTALGKMAAGVAHDVNNPLTLIREGAGWIKDIIDDAKSDATANYTEIRNAADKIEFHVDRAKSVTQRLLGFGRRMEPRQENLNLNVLAEQTMTFLQQEAMHRNIRFEKQFSNDLPQISTDAAQVQQVILNLLDNALDAIEKDGTCGIETGIAPGGREVFLQVSDTGPGIPKEIQDRIFDPFFTTKNVGEGTGLGLSICYGIMENLGGRITANSKDDGGATFTIYLPMFV